MSSIAPLVSQRIARQCAAKGVEMLDAPVSGGEPGAINARLAIMVGGKQEVFDKCFDLLKTMGSNVVLTGSIGAGGVTKLANQIIVAANIEALSEALVLAQKAGVDPEKVFNAIRGGLAGSAVMEAKGPMMLDRNFRAGFRVRLHQKDLRNVLQTAQELNVPLPVTALLQQMLGALVNEGEAEAEHAAGKADPRDPPLEDLAAEGEAGERALQLGEVGEDPPAEHRHAAPSQEPRGPEEEDREGLP
jgi:2-hydroxy-3-oxopropionate reductase